MRPFHGDLAIGMVIGVRTFVKGHDDIRAQILLDLDGFFGCEAVRGAVDVTLEGDTFVVNFAGLSKREDLETARIGQHGIWPLHELMQATQIGNQFIAGTK